MFKNRFFEKRLEFEVIELAASTLTANDAATNIGCQIGQIVKSLLFCTKETKKPVLILASGINRVNEDPHPKLCWGEDCKG